MKVKALVSGIDTQVNARGFILEEQIDSASIGSSATLPTITAPVIRLTNASLLSISSISVPSTVNEVTVVNDTGNAITLNFGIGAPTGLQMGATVSEVLQNFSAATFIYSNSKWIMTGIIGVYASLTSNYQIFSGLQQEFTNKVWFNGGIRLVDQVSTFTSVDFLQSPSQTVDTWYTLPPDLGTANQYLKNDGTGILSWATPAGGGGSLNTASATVDFGSVGDYVTAIIAASWVTPTSTISLTITPHLTDHDYEDVLLENLTCTVGAIVNGVSFDIHVHAPNDTWGRYIIKAQGA